jgi:PAS domain S-box-containing protein
LSGPWRFYWQAFLDPNSSFSPTTLQKHSYITVPGSWNGHKHDGKKISGHGFATYRLKVLLKPQEQRLALKLPDMATAYQVYVNGKLVYSSGLPGKTADTSIPYLSPNIVSFEADAGHLDILVHVSNFHHRLGGMWESVKLGGMDEMHAHQEKMLLFNFFLLGSIIIMGLYHIGLYWTRKDDKASLYFGIFCILMGARLLSTGQRYILNLVPGMDFEWLHKVIYVSFYMCVPFFAMYVKSLFSREFSGKIVSAAKILALVLSFLVFFTPARIYSFTMPAFQIFTLLLLFYGIWVVILSIKRARTDALIFLFGFLVLTGVTLNDILYTRQIIDTGHYFQIGFFIFIFTQAFIISKRFSMAFSIIENQSHELKTANTGYEQELTRRKKTEKSLIESEQKYRYLFENGADLLCIHDLDGNLTETNLCFRHEYGWTQEDLIGINIREIIPTRHRHKFDRYMGKIITDGSDEGLVTGVKKSGEEVTVEYRNKLIYDSEGKPKSVQGTAKDVTKWFKAEKALRKAKKDTRGSFSTPLSASMMQIC